MLKWIRYFLVGLLLGTIGCTGTTRPSSGRTNPEWMEAVRQQHAQTEMASMRAAPAEVETVKEAEPAPASIRPLTLEDAIAYALAHNLDAAVKQLESDIQKEAVVGARLKMLPALTLDGEISARNDYDASYSEPLFTQGAQDYNYSRDKTAKRFNAELSWDLLNFGIAYYQQRQASDQYRISEQQRQRVIQNLKFDVVKIYWQLLAAQRSMHLAQGVVQRLAERERILQKQFRAQTTSELEALATAVALSEMRMNMSGFEHEYRRCKSKMATFLGLPADSAFEIVDPGDNPSLADTPVDIAALETEALLHRPELFEKDMEERIAKEDARIAIARTMPKPSLFYRYSHDDDTHLYSNDWHEVGVRMTMDLLSVPQQFSQKREAVIKQTLVRTQRQSLAAAVLTQLRIAAIDFEDALRKYRHSEEIADKRKLLLEARRRHAALGNGAYEAVIESEAEYLLAQVRGLLAYAEVLIAEQRILNSVGSDDIGKKRFLVEARPLLSKESISDRRPLPAKDDPAVKAVKTEPVQRPAGDVLPEKSSRTATSAAHQNRSEPLPYALQLSSWGKEEEARAMLSEYAQKGLNAYIVQVDVPGIGLRWRCYEGHYRSAREARQAKQMHGLSKAMVIKGSHATH